MERHLTTKGIFIKKIRTNTFVLEDIFGNCTLQFFAEDIESASANAYKLGKVQVIAHESELKQTSSLKTFRWFELDEYYVCRLSDHFRYWLVGRNAVQTFDMLSRFLPAAYLDCGFGDGDRNELETIHKNVVGLAENGRVPFSKEFVTIKLYHIQLQRICSDLLALLQRAIRAFLDLLTIQRIIIKEEFRVASLLGSKEIIHTGPKSYNAATCITICVVSLCTSLDISSKLIHFLNICSRPAKQFKNAQGKLFSDLPKMRPSTLPVDLLTKIICRSSQEDAFASLIQLRHDLIHSTAALEMEKIYLGYQTQEINELPLHYSYMPWRDCSENGQPLRYLGREYFTSQGIDIELQLTNWIRAVIGYHLFIGEQLYEFIMSQTLDCVGIRLS